MAELSPMNSEKSKNPGGPEPSDKIDGLEPKDSPETDEKEILSEPDPWAEAFYGGALSRIGKVMPVLAGIGAVVAWRRYGWVMALGFALGCAIAYVNFQWLARVVTAMLDRAMYTGGKGEKKGPVVFRFLVRYALLALGAYGIYKLSPRSVNGMLAGLFTPVAAIACEIVYEVLFGAPHRSAVDKK